MRNAALTAGIVSVSLVLVAAEAPAEPAGFPSHKLECEGLASERTRSICRRFEEEMAWTWFGHAVVSPGWRITWETDRRVWCKAGITMADRPALQELAKSGDWRLQGGADALLQILQDDAPEGSILNRMNPQYVLQAGCP